MCVCVCVCVGGWGEVVSAAESPPFPLNFMAFNLSVSEGWRVESLLIAFEAVVSQRI
jgi:hypothetical protein